MNIESTAKFEINDTFITVESALELHSLSRAPEFFLFYLAAYKIIDTPVGARAEKNEKRRKKSRENEKETWYYSFYTAETDSVNDYPSNLSRAQLSERLRVSGSCI